MQPLNSAAPGESRSAPPKYDLAIACRVCSIPSNSKPPIFAEDKLKLIEFCAKSLKASVGKLRAKLWVVLTGPPEYERMFESIWPKEDLVVLSVGRIGNPKSLRQQIDILCEQTDADYVFLAEDDYFYLPGTLESALEFLRSEPEESFVSLYDIPDNYTDPYQLSSDAEARIRGDHAWHPRAATTHTFLTRRTTLQQCRDVFSAVYWFGKKVWGSDTDTAHWLALTKRKFLNPAVFVQSLFKYRYWAACVFLAFFFRTRQVLFGKRYTLWIPQPSMSTHMIAGDEAPGVNWQQEFQRCLSNT
jgi:hypothetical protein